MRLSFLNNSFLVAVVVLFFSAFYFQSNLGGEGLFIPFNLVVWIAIASVISLAVWLMLKQNFIRLPTDFRLIFAMPFFILLTGFIVGMEHPLSWMLRISAIFLGFLLFFSLFQFKASRRTIHTALYVLCGVFSLHAVVGIVQLLPGKVLANLIPNIGNQIPIGVFQQPNLQASLMATAVILSVYLLSTPDFCSRRLWIKLLPLLCALLSMFVLVSAGSRVGLLGGGIALALVLCSRFSLLKYRKGWAVSMLIVLLIGSSASLDLNDAAPRAYSKMERLTEEAGHQDIRKYVYLISWDIIKDKPLLGHGIGSFKRVFHEKAAEYQLATEDFKLGTRFTHPHNELLLWGIEAGLLGLLGFAFAVTAVIR